MVDQVAPLIREAQESDLRALEWEGRYKHFRRLYRQAMREAQQGRRILLVAELEEEIVGQLFVQLESRAGRLADGSTSERTAHAQQRHQTATVDHQPLL